MSKSKPNKEKPKSEREVFFDAIFGPDEELTERVAREILDTYRVTGEQLVDNFKARLKERMKRIHDETGTVSEPLAATLRNVSEYQRERAPKPIAADEYIAAIFSDSPLPNMREELLYNLRNRGSGEVSENDKRILNEITDEIESSEG